MSKKNDALIPQEPTRAEKGEEIPEFDEQGWPLDQEQRDKAVSDAKDATITRLSSELSTVQARIEELTTFAQIIEEDNAPQIGGKETKHYTLARRLLKGMPLEEGHVLIPKESWDTALSELQKERERGGKLVEALKQISHFRLSNSTHAKNVQECVEIADAALASYGEPGAGEDASRWRALMTCERIRVLGSAGLGSEHQHIGLELWDKYPGCHSDGATDLVKFVDTIIHRDRAALASHGDAEAEGEGK